ncbi:hypothetical protein N3930_46700, partial [Bacillus thuringiensis]|nr:hypothetical protein [Bacillus thuringiensis]
LENTPGAEVTVDLESRTVRCGSVDTTFEIDNYTRWRLMEGLDDISLTLKEESSIREFEASRLPFKPKTLPARI